MKIKELLKQYRVFFLLLAINLFILFVMPETGRRAVSITLDNFKEMLAVFPPIFILLGLLDVWVDRAAMMKYTGNKSGLKEPCLRFCSDLQRQDHFMRHFPSPPLC